jgi:hypothetical protein
MKVLNPELGELNLPDFLCVGAAKSGTTSLFAILDQHSRISIPVKEPHFLSAWKNSDADAHLRQSALSDLQAYSGLYADRPEMLHGDLSTTYLYYHRQTLAAIRELYGHSAADLKIFMILRNPVKRAFSHYMMLVKNGVEALPFEEAIKPETVRKRAHERHGFDYLGYGLYHDQVKAYLDSFPGTRVYLLEELKNPDALTADLLAYLGLEQERIDTQFQTNQSGIPRNRQLVNLLKSERLRRTVHLLLPGGVKKHARKFKQKAMDQLLVKQTISDESNQVLTDFYRDDIARLEALLGKETGWLEN